MSKKDGTFFNMKLTQTQKEIMDFIASEIYGGNSSKASVVIDLVRNKAYEYLNFGDVNFSDEMLLLALLNNKKEKEMLLIQTVGVDNYKKMIEEYKEKHGYSDDVKIHEELVKEYEEKSIKEEKVNE